MPQIWMTYDEIAGLTDADATTAHALVHERALDRRKSHDGRTRIKLDLDLTALFLAKVRGADVLLDQSIQELRRLHAEMARATRIDASLAGSAHVAEA